MIDGASMWMGVAGVGGFLFGLLFFRVVSSISLKRKVLNAELEARKTANQAEIEASRITEKAMVEIRVAEERIRANAQRLSEKESCLNTTKAELDTRLNALKSRESEFIEAKSALDAERSSLKDKLVAVSSMSPEEVHRELLSQVEREAAKELAHLKHELAEKSEVQLQDEARHLLLSAMQRITTTPSTQTTATIVDLPSEDMKGRIIGREGRNIRSFEAVTGTTLMIDETPDSVLISAFDPVKREIAKLALEELLKDGRIHPSTIEASVEKARTQVQLNVKSLGEQALHRLKLGSAHPEIVELLGRLHFRLSLNQNSLEHSLEVAFIASMLASELGLDPVIAKRAALFHDLGKAIDHEFEGSHAAAAARILERYNEDPRVVNAVAASHEEIPASSPYAPLIVIADRISAMRPGARSDSLDSYVQRVKALESLAAGFDGVKEAFALQAGREIRVIVEPDRISDQDARELARSISREIENTLNYPSSIKITVIREKRFSEVAK